jgi:two-component system chemotaxis sensor kinase CheA
MDDIFIQFRQKFIDEALSLISSLEKSLICLETNSDDKEAIEEVFRVAHTLKGVSSMYGFDKISEYTHKLESLFDKIRDQTLTVNTQIIDLTLESADHIKNLLSDIDFTNSNNQTKHLELLTRIAVFVSDENIKLAIKREVLNQTDKKTRTFYICFYPDEQLLYRGVKIVNIFNDLAEIGTFKIFKHLPNVINNENFDSENIWGVILTTTETVEAIEDVFLFVEDNYKLYKLDDSNIYDELPQKEEKANEISGGRFNIENLVNLPENELENLLKQKVSPHSSEKPEIEIKQSKSVQNISVSSRISVETQKLDLLMYLVSELVTSNAQLKLGYTNFDKVQLGQVAEKIEKLTKQFRDNAFSLRLIPIEENVVSFQRLIRDLSNTLHKKIKFVIQGGETELDKSIIDKLMEPLMHLVRNCIDHGIETPEKRIANGKNPTGKINFIAYYSGNHIIIRIEDDGAGIDNEKVIKKAVENGIISNDALLSQTEIYNLIFLPGFSTAENLSEISGRGVGMDIVKRKIQELHGEIQIESKLNVGTTFIIKLHQTVSIIDTLLIRIGTSIFAIPLAEIENCQLQADKSLLDKQNKQLDYMGQLIPYINLRYEFDCFSKNEERQKVLVINRSNKKFAIIVDEIIGEYQAVIKPIGNAFNQIKFIYGASILGNGSIALLLDTEKLINNY